MSFGFDQKDATLPYVETQNAVKGEITPFPRVKYHEQYPQGLTVNDEVEEASLGDGWVDSPAEFGVETHPSVDKSDPVQVRLAEIRGAIKASKGKAKAK